MHKSRHPLWSCLGKRMRAGDPMCGNPAIRGRARFAWRLGDLRPASGLRFCQITCRKLAWHGRLPAPLFSARRHHRILAFIKHPILQSVSGQSAAAANRPVFGCHYAQCLQWFPAGKVFAGEKRRAGWRAKRIHLPGVLGRNESWTPAGFAVYCIGRVALFDHVSIRVADQRYRPAG